MKGFKKIAVMTNVYEMGKGRTVSVRDISSEPILKDRIFGLLDANKRNADYKNKRRWIEIDWVKTAELQMNAGNLDWLDYVLEEKRLECKVLKRSIDFPVKDSYKEALQDGEELKKTNDYISVVEDHIAVLESIEFKPKETEEVEGIAELKAIIKEESLGIRVSKTDTIEEVEAKIKEARESK